MVAEVSPWAVTSVVKAGAEENVEASGQSAQASSSETLGSAQPEPAPANVADTTAKNKPRLRASYLWAAAAALCLALVVALLPYGKFQNKSSSASSVVTPLPQKSVAVLPFLDLTDEMNQEPFADGMTEELIDKLSKIPGLRVPPPTSSFYFKSKLWPRSEGAPQTTIADISKALGVAYLLDGSVRKSGDRLRVDARLIRGDSGYVVWSESYDRPFNDILRVQDDIAGEVTKALKASIEARPN
jgi:TolB-like protein